jgi:hypothetical protein
VNKALLLAMILSLFSGFADDVCALCVPSIQADGIGAIDDGLAVGSQRRLAPTGPAGDTAAPAHECVFPFTSATPAWSCCSALPLRATDPVYCFMSIQR